MTFPQDKQFAFTIIDDTDSDTIENTRPVYEFLTRLGFKTTKTVWVFAPRDGFKGLSLENYRYRQHIKKLQKSDFEIALHGVGSGKFNREEIIDGLKIYHRTIGQTPKIQINHGQNPDNLYWGSKRFSLLRPFWPWGKFSGEKPKSDYFWGDYAQRELKFIRNFTFKELNILRADPFMPYRESSKKYANYWFSSTDAPNLEKFNRIVNQNTIDELIKEKGLAIIYTHFAEGFVRGGKVDRTFEKNMTYLSRQKGWFVPAGEVLEHLLKHGKGGEINLQQKLSLETRWLRDRLF